MLSSAPSSVPNPIASGSYPSFDIDENVRNFISSVEGVPDALEIEDGSNTEEIDDAEDVAINGDRPVNRTYYINCEAVYTNSFNAKGVKVKDSGNHLPQVSCMSCSLSLLQFMAQENFHVSIRSWWHGCRPSK